MAKKRDYTGKLATPISLKEAKERGPAALVERLELLAEHYGIDHRDQTLNEWLAPLAIALAEDCVPGFQIKTTPVRPGGRPAVRKVSEDVAVLRAVEQYQDEHMQGRRNYKRACEHIVKRVREETLTPEIKQIPETYLVSDMKGGAAGKLRGACDRGRNLRREFPEVTPIGALFFVAPKKL
jgi:hypothetical protein